MEAVDEYPCDCNGGIDRDHGVGDIAEDRGLENTEQEKANGYFRQGYKCLVHQDECKKALAETGSACVCAIF